MNLDPAALPRLNRAEWQAVSIAINDAANAGCAGQCRRRRFTQWIGRIARAITGNEPPRPLADQRLESLRGLVCAVRRRHRPDAAAIDALMAHGFTRAEVDALVVLSA